ncbi:ribonuclease P protein component [Dissulfurirhabdus thermomarina]|uniref:Ribonuclease P protein component n=1 Tax=Dissulfurirhabdus thermomarina TaxID=1765737 RepID=A0A6N9TQ14_DISTH|nr:ribonuclease P protein component [Dissulfurirhabdus thermomarina]NDY43365.1 ribonuclease P protein component [Dissulfurirhabdus thermomarina]NMX23412.1 ribonuclease P protein component [Dissulfurirhabdus thermomarina]
MDAAPGARLRKRERMRRRADFEAAYRSGRRIRLPGLTLVLAPNGLPFSRIGLSASRRLGGAVKRNRAKRVCREIFRRNKALFPPGHDVVFIPGARLLEMSTRELEAAIARALARDRRPAARRNETR